MLLTLVESTPSTSALVRSVALMVVLRTPSTQTWYESMVPGGASGGFQPIRTLLFSCLSSVSCFGAGTRSEKNTTAAAVCNPDRQSTRTRENRTVFEMITIGLLEWRKVGKQLYLCSATSQQPIAEGIKGIQGQSYDTSCMPDLLHSAGTDDLKLLS